MTADGKLEKHSVEGGAWSLVIRPQRNLFDLRLGELWQYRDLISLFVRRDFVSVYKQTILGPLWYVIQPILTTVIFTIIFGRIAGLSTDGLPKFLFYMSGTVVWSYFADCLTKTSNTFITNSQLFGKVYFPRLAVPISILISGLIGFSIQFLLFIGFTIYYIMIGAAIQPNIWILITPVLLVMMAGLGLGFGVIVSSLTTRYRDLRFLVTFGISLWMYLTPVIYPVSSIPEPLRPLIQANPLTPIVEAFRYAYLGTGTVDLINLLYSAVVMIVVLFVGTLLFNRIEATFMDTVNQEEFMTIAIHVENLSKEYRLGQIGGRTLREDLNRWWARRRGLPDPTLKIGEAERDPRFEETIWALRDVSFDVEQGKVLGIIGRNGAGKSTLLKILSRITAPTSGQIKVRGRTASLLEVGTGFHPELTGRENIYLNGAILGMKQQEIERKFEEIVEFSEVQKFIDTPVKRYSSGMYVRLAFAVAAHLEPEILVVDEVLAVGDAEFQRKCLGKMSDVARSGRTVLFVSHNMSAVLRLTEDAIVLNKGNLVLYDETPRAVDFYMSSGFAQVGERLWSAEEFAGTTSPFQPRSLRLCDAQGRILETARSTEPLIVEFHYILNAPITGLRVGLYLQTARGEMVLTSFDIDEPAKFEALRNRPAGEYISRCVIPADLLNEGRYVLGVNASSYHVRRYFQDEQAISFTVDATGAPGAHWSEMRMGPIRPRLAWEILSQGDGHAA